MTDRCWDTDPRVRSTAGYGVAVGESVTVPEEGSRQKCQRRWWWRALAVLTPPVCPGPLRRPRDGLDVQVMMDAEGAMSSASGVEGSLVPGLFPSKKGGEIALPTCVHCHVAKSRGISRVEALGTIKRKHVYLLYWAERRRFYRSSGFLMVAEGKRESEMDS
jgi:hypothetical protein